MAGNVYETVWNQGYQVLSGEDKNHSSRLILSNNDFFGQINSKIHWSPGMHHVQVMNKIYCPNQWKCLENRPFSVHLWCSFYWPVFVVIFLSKINFMPILSIHSYFVFILVTQYCKPFMTSAYNLPGKSEKPKKFAVKLIITKRNHFGVS